MFVPIVGGVSQSTLEQTDVQSNQVAKEFAKKFGGVYTQFLSPAVFSEKKVMEYFLKEKSVNFIFEDFKKLDTLVMGIGIPERGGSTLLQAGYITEDEMARFEEDGMVGDMPFSFSIKTGKQRSSESSMSGWPECLLIDQKVPNRIGIGEVPAGRSHQRCDQRRIYNMLITTMNAQKNCCNVIMHKSDCINSCTK
jgi:hypothetical protein